jgi:hypothetical protein
VKLAEIVKEMHLWIETDVLARITIDPVDPMDRKGVFSKP